MYIEYIDKLIHANLYDKALDEIENLPEELSQFGELYKGKILTYKGDCNSAIEIIDSALRKNNNQNISMEYYASCIKTNILYQLNKDYEAIELTEYIDKYTNNSENSSIELSSSWYAIYQMSKGLLNLRLKKYPIALKSCLQSLELFTEFGNLNMIYQLLPSIALIHEKMNEFNLALSYYFEYLWFIKDRNSITEGKAYENIGNLYLNKGLFDHAIHYFFKSQDIFDKLQSFENKARVIHILGIIFLNRGDHEIAQEYFQNAKDLSSKIGDDKGIGWSILHLGLLEFKMGDLSSALVLLNQCFNLFRNIDDKLMMAWSLRSIGDIHRVKGEFEKALNYYEKDIQELEGFDNSWILADTYNKIGQIYFKKGMIDLAIENYQISTSLYLKLGDWLSASDPVFNLIIVKLDLKLFNHATDLLNFLESLKNRSNDKIVKLRYTIAKALILKNNTRIIQKVKAQEMLTQITNEEIIDHELTVICMINLCELLLHELRTYQQDEVLSDIINLSTKLLLIAQDQKSYWLLVEVLILKAKLALIEGNAEEALNLLNSADEIVDARNLEQQKFKINIEQDNLQVTLEIWKELTSVNASIRERMDLSGIEDYIEKIFNQ